MAGAGTHPRRAEPPVSEYQYYEFLAIDRPLTQEEMRTLRGYSTRARITPTSFTNHYNFGNFRGDEGDWMERFFDAFLYVANWGTHILMLGFPSRLLDIETARTYCAGRGATASERGGKVILAFLSEEERGEWEDGEGWLSSLIPLRADIARGDLRALYIAWLLCAQREDLDDLGIEPPVPPGLGTLSAPLESLVRFLRIDGDLASVAAQSSRPLETVGLSHQEVLAWVGCMPGGEKDELLARIIEGEDSALPIELRRRCIEERDTKREKPAEERTRRTVRELLAAAREQAAARRRIAAREAAREEARHAREAARARARHLDGLAGQEARLWEEVERLIAVTQPKEYDRAIEILIDLRDLAARGEEKPRFAARVEALRVRHARKPSFIERMRKAGL